MAASPDLYILRASGLKRCMACRVEKPFDDFSRDNSRSDGRQPRCKECYNSYLDKNRKKVMAQREICRANIILNDPEKIRAPARAYANRRYSENPKAVLAISKRWREANIEKLAKYRKDTFERDKARIYAANAARRAMRIKATPSWASKEAMLAIYEKAQYMSLSDGLKYHVDHIVPLKSKTVCGLHCEANLQIILSSENLRKSNRQWPNMPK